VGHQVEDERPVAPGLLGAEHPLHQDVALLVEVGHLVVAEHALGGGCDHVASPCAAAPAGAAAPWRAARPGGRYPVRVPDWAKIARSPEGVNHATAPGGRGATVELGDVTVRFGGRKGDGGTVAVDHLSLRVEPGEVCVLVGPSGCGKTTTLRLVNRLVEPAAGRVLIAGRAVATVDPVELRRGIGYVIQQIGLFPHRTVAENVATVPRLLGWPEGRIRARVDELLTLIGLDPGRVRDRYPGQLSGGERQRVGVARAMAARPPLMLMDEPFGAVDPIVRARLQDEFLRLRWTQGTTVLFVTHDIDEAIKMGTRVAVLQAGGKLAQYSPPAHLLLHPASEDVARFVGADRVLKRLALLTLADLDLEHGPAPGE